MEHAIMTKDLTKEFDGLAAVDRVNLDIERGESFGLLGPNGAGKTTLIKMLSTLLKPTSGYAEVAGHNILTEESEVRESIGIVFQDISLDTELTGRENLDFHVRMYGMPKKLREERMPEVLHLVKLEDKADIQVKYYSGGMQRRLEIARGLMHYPKVLFLDEPTLGLDAQTRRIIWDYIKKLAKTENITTILTTHYMDEADYLCDRVGIMDFGKVIALDTPTRLKNAAGADVISLEVPHFLKEMKKALSDFEWVQGIKSHNARLDVDVKMGELMIPKIMEIAQKIGAEIHSVSLRKPTLEDVFLRYTGKTIRAGELSKKDMGKHAMKRQSKMWRR